MKTPYKKKRQLIDALGALQERVRELESIERAYEQLKQDFVERVNRHSSSIEFTDRPIYVIFDRKFEFINERYSQMFDVWPEEVYNSRFNPMTLIAPESRQLIWEKYKEGISGKYKSQQFTFTGLAKNGSKIDCETFSLFIPYKWGIAMHGIVWNKMADKRFVDSGDDISALHTPSF